MKTIKLPTLFLLFITSIIHAQIVEIPDANFKTYLVSNISINTDGDDEISVMEAQSFSGSINVEGLSIKDMTGIDSFWKLKNLYCSDNQITRLELYNNPDLEQLYCYNNNLKILDLTRNVKITQLFCENNLLKSVNVSALVDLEIFNCSNNLLKVLDVSNNSNLQEIRCTSNSLTVLDLKNGNNTGLTGFLDFTGNPKLNCIQVDSKAYSNSNWSSYKDVTATYNTICYVNIPDTDFENKLVTDTDINTNGDSKISYAEASALESSIILDFTASSMSDLTGLEAFQNIILLRINNADSLQNIDISPIPNLQYLYLNDNNLKNIDLTYSKSLLSLYIDANEIANIDVSENKRLRVLTCSNNRIASIDITNNPSIIHMNCAFNNLSALNIANGNNENFDITFSNFKSNPNLNCIQVDDVAYSNTNWSGLKDTSATYGNLCYVNIPDANLKNALLTDLTINTNNDTEISYEEATNYYGEISVSGLSISDATGIEAFPNITLLKISNNLLTNLDATHNSKLVNLICGNNQITDLNVDNLIQLRGLNLATNNLENIDISTNLRLGLLDCKSNQLTSLDISKNTILFNVLCSYNNLTELNLANGNNTNFSNNTSSNNFKNNPSLSCIQVDDASYSNANWSVLKDATASYSEDCSTTLYNLTINSNNGRVTKNPSSTTGNYTAGTAVELTARPDEDFQFDGWSGDATGTTNPLTITIDANKTITANFSIIQTSLTLNATNGSITTNPNSTDGTYDINTDITLTATADPRYQFVEWTGDASGSTNPIEIEMDGDKNVTAVFSKIQRTLTLNATNGIIRTNPNPTGGSYDDGTDITLTATADAGYQFVEWSGDTSGSTNPLTLTMNTDKSVTAVFSKIQRTLTLNATNGSITFNPNPTDGTYDDSETITLTATPNAGFQFDGWDGDALGSGKTNPLTITMDADKTISAVFSIIEYKLTTNASNGTIITDKIPFDIENHIPRNGMYDNGTELQLTATPDTGYQFVEWTGDASGSTNPLPITMNSNKSITALFSLQATASIANSTFDKTIIVYPNPVKDVLEVKSATNQLIKRIEVFTLLGKKIMQQKSSTIDFTQLSKGIYIIEIQNDKGYTAIRKVVKE